GAVNATSLGFIPIESEPLGNGTRGGRRITRSRLLEISYVNLPALDSAIVNARMNRLIANTDTEAGRRCAAEQLQRWFAEQLTEERRAEAERRKAAFVTKERLWDTTLRL